MLTKDYSKNFTTTSLLTIEHIDNVVELMVIPIIGQAYGSVTVADPEFASI